MFSALTTWNHLQKKLQPDPIQGIKNLVKGFGGKAQLKLDVHIRLCKVTQNISILFWCYLDLGSTEKGILGSQWNKCKWCWYCPMIKKSSNRNRTVWVKHDEVGKQDIYKWAMGGWSPAYEGGRYLGCCWNLVPPTGNYRVVSLPVTTAVPGLPADRPWFNTQIPPHPC